MALAASRRTIDRGRVRRRHQLDRQRHRRTRRRPRRARRACRLRRPRRRPMPRERVAFWKTQFTTAARAAQDAAAASAATEQVGNVANPPSCTFVTRDRRRTVSLRARGSATAAPTGSATTAPPPNSPSTIRGRAARSRTASPARSPKPTPVPTRSPVGSASTAPAATRRSPRCAPRARDGCWSAPTDSGTTARMRSSCAISCLTIVGNANNDPLAAAGTLVDWANAQGGHDNITVALARVQVTTEVAARQGARRWRTGKPKSSRTSTSPADATDVHAIVTVGCSESGQAGRSGGTAAEVIVVDTSGSMSSPHDKIIGRAPGRRGRDRRDPRRHVLRGDRGQSRSPARVPLPGRHDARRTSKTRAEAHEAVRHLGTEGGTAIGKWLRARSRSSAPYQPSQRHAILLTDGRDETETPADLQRRDPSAPRACSSATAAASAPGLGSQRAARHLVRVARNASTSSPIPRRWPPTSRRSWKPR